MKIQIKTSDNNYIHLDFDNAYTLCGLDTIGDIDIEPGIYTNKKINCPDCINIIKVCKKVKSTDIQ